MDKKNSVGTNKYLLRFPKERPHLSDSMKAIHKDILIANRERRTLFSKVSYILESWMHRKVASTARSNSNARTLEIGAGTLNHLSFENLRSNYDIIEPFSELYRQKPNTSIISDIYKDIREIETEVKYDRIVSIATLEHITDLPYVVALSGLHLTENGVFSAGIPSEGGFLWGVAWRLSTAIAFRLKTGLRFGEHMKFEHVNDAFEIIEVVRIFFRKVKVRSFPLPFFHFSLYLYIEATDPIISNCRDYSERFELNDRS